MIQQGMDCLSWGIWATALHPWVNQHVLTTSVFAPVPFLPMVVNYLLARAPFLTGKWRYRHWTEVFHMEHVFDCLTVWFPSPKLARQTIIFYLEAWVECPLTSSALFVVPRTIADCWHHLTRHVQEIGIYAPSALPLPSQSFLQILTVVLCVASHQRSLPSDSPSDRVEFSAALPNLGWHKEQVALLRGLPAANPSQPA